MILRLRRSIPFGLRVELLRLLRYPAWLLETPSIARQRGSTAAKREVFPYLAAEHRSPLLRGGPDAAAGGREAEELQRGKERNVGLAAALIDGLIVGPCQTFSYHRCVGRPSRLRGFSDGLELRDGAASRGVGGGCCQISNMVYLLALLGGMKITERHRHGLDLFPDQQRSVPFGCGATVSYNYADLRFENPLPGPALLRLTVAGGELHGRLLLERDPGWRVQVYQQDHRFYREGGGWIRENRVRRSITAADSGRVLLDEEVAHNVARVLYEPAGVVRRLVRLPVAA